MRKRELTVVIGKHLFFACVALIGADAFYDLEPTFAADAPLERVFTGVPHQLTLPPGLSFEARGSVATAQPCDRITALTRSKAQREAIECKPPKSIGSSAAFAGIPERKRALEDSQRPDVLRD
jgi:hypothetical protein